MSDLAGNQIVFTAEDEANVRTINSIRKENEKMRELLHDLNAILKTAMHNGHHDLIQRVADICKESDT